MDIRTQSALLAAIVALALGLSLLLRAERPRVHTLFSILAFTLGGFYLSRFLWGVLEAPMAGTSWWVRPLLGANIVLGAFVPSAVLGFFLEFLQVSARSARRGRQFALFTIVLGVAVGVSPLAESLWARVSVALWVFATMAILVGQLLVRSRATESRIERIRLMYLSVGAGVTITFSALDFLHHFDFDIPTLGPVFATLYLFLLSQTLLRHRLMDLHELLGKIASQTVLAVILALVFVVLTVWVESNVSLFLFNTAVAAFVMLILLEPLRAWVEEKVVAVFFRERFEMLRSLGALKQRTANIIDVGELAAILLDSLNETRRVTHASVFLLADDRPGFRLLDFRGPAPIHFIDPGTARSLTNALGASGKVVLLENIERRIIELRGQPSEGKRAREEIKRLLDVKSVLQAMKAGISIPLTGNDRLIGFFNLWDERVPEAYASDEIALLLELGEHLATVVENSKLYEKMRERDRLAALGEMSAGLAHEIRNPLGAIKGAVQCLTPESLPEEDREFLEVIIEEVNRLNGVVTAFLDYARPLKQNFGHTDLNEVVSRTVRLVQNEIPSRITLSTELSETLAKVSADAEQLKQVLINLIQNAAQALGNRTGTIHLKTMGPDRESEMRPSEWVELHVVDDGPGIPTGAQENIFVPFFTTKQKGTGLGLAICQRIVKNHGGSISVLSRPEEGSRFIVRLPALAAEAPSPASLPTKPTEVEPAPLPPAASRRDRRRRRQAR